MPFPTTRLQQLVRQHAARLGYCRTTQQQLARVATANGNYPLSVQAQQAVPLPHQSATTKS